MALKFYMTPGSCSTGIHILLETLELPFEVWLINLPAGENRRPEYLKINPKGTIPTLVLDDGKALTDFKSIAIWLAETNPRGKLLPEEPQARQRVIDELDFALEHLHGQGFTRVFTPDRHLPPGSDEQGTALKSDVIAHGRDIVADGFSQLERRLSEDGYVAGPMFTIADAAMFYTEFWADRSGIELPPRVRAHYKRVSARPVVRQVLAEEGYRL